MNEAPIPFEQEFPEEGAFLMERIARRKGKCVSFRPSSHIHVAMPAVGRNDPCPCESSKKFKKCCGRFL